jgi:hypothetical protein
MPSAHSFASHAAIRRQHEALGRDALECAADMFDRSTLQRMVVNDADADFLVDDVLPKASRSVSFLGSAAVGGVMSVYLRADMMIALRNICF